MKFVRGSKEEAVRAISERIIGGLEDDERVLWLISGGSNIALECDVMHVVRTSAEGLLPKLIIIPMDERYGEAGFTDSNTQQLRQAGFDPGVATWIDVLDRNLPLSETISYYSDATATAFADAQLVVGQFGMGDDAHIAGIKPGSPATAPGSETVVGYEWNDYIRMTLGAEALIRIDVAYLVAYGPDKRLALERLRDDREPYEQLPAKLLYELPEVYVYNDHMESEAKQ